jgi:tetratricopeptide (TPR) repeat protein
LRIETLAAGLKKGGYSGLRDTYQAFIADPVHIYIVNALLEARINKMGYDLLGRKLIDDAIAILRLNTQAFPASYNAWNSLGEAYALAGKKEDTIVAYKESLRLNPTSTSGLDALSNLQKK